MFTGGNHLGIATRDLDRSVSIWSERYNLRPWTVREYGSHNMTRTDGGPAFRMRLAHASISDSFRIELLQPLDEVSPYFWSLERHAGKDHIHHVRLDVPELEIAVEKLNALGLGTELSATFSGRTETGGRFECYYFDTREDLGFAVEVGAAPAGYELAPPDSVRA